MERGSNETGITSSNNTPSPDQKPQVSNASLDLLSDYSSCEESEFERYCSANSVMGTPSMCSSVGTFNDFLDLDDGGVEFRSGNYNRDRRMSLSKIERWSRSLPTSEERSSVIRNGRGTSNGDNGLESAHNTNGETSLRRSMYGDNGSGDLSLLENPGVNGASQVIGVESKEEAHDAYDPFDVKESGNLEDEEISSRYELSDDDSSMGSYGMDDERRMGLYNMSNLHDLQNSESNNDNPLIVGSAVAFGSDDWHDFIQENEENNLVSSLFDIPEQEQQENRGTEGMLLNSVSLLPVSAPNIASSEQSRDVENGAKGREIQERFSNGGGFPQEKDFLADKGSRVDLNVTTIEREVQCIPNKEDNRSDVGTASENDSFGELELLNSLSNMSIFDRSLSTAGESHGQVAVHFQEQEVHELQAAIEDDFKATEMANSNYCPTSVDQSEEHPAPIKVGKLKDSYDELVLEMEEILLDSTGTPGSRFPQSNRSTRPFRDGSSTASTSGSVDSYPLVQILQKVDGVEVIGAKQKKGDVSLGERLVGVKEYTVYMLRVWSGNDQWEVERRYRDFFKLYRQLKTLYANHGWSLPTPWSSVEQESRKLFGNASPTIVSARSTLIQECLRSILHSDTPNSVPVTLNWFLFPEKIITSSSLLNTLSPQPPSILTGVTSIEDVPTFGKTISLLVEIQPHKSVKQLLEAQHYECAGCHKRFDTEKTLMQEFAHTLGWGKPRLCEYSGQLFCASCHTNETSVLPARVLHFWDFTEYPVSQMAKSYLDSIYDQPMLCVSAVNPFLFSKVPALLHLMGIRKKVGAMMPYVRCPFRRSIQKGVGSRRYLLENNEFFALRDLIDLSKGAFSVLPVMVQTVSTKILDHITQQCLVCCDVGIPCGARQTCEDPSSLIFPFQENEIKKCRSCESVFHKPCFKKIVSCPCGAGSDVPRIGNSAPDVSPKSNEALKTVAKRPDSGSPVRFLSYLFSNTRQEKELRHKNSNPVILMGSLPSTFSDPL